MRIIKNILCQLSLWFLNRFVMYIPFHIIRDSFCRFLRIRIGRGSQVDMGQYILGPSHLKIGSGSHINEGCILDGRGGLIIGDSVSISHRVKLITGTHDINSHNFSGSTAPIIIGDYAFIGVGSTILSGSRIGKGAVVCAGAIVTRDIPDFAVVAGIPATQIGIREHDLDYKCTPERWFV